MNLPAEGLTSSSTSSPIERRWSMPRGTQCHMAPTSKVGRDWCLGARFRGASVAAEARDVQPVRWSQRDAPRFTVTRVRRTCRASRPSPKQTPLHSAAPQYVLRRALTRRSERAEVNKSSANPDPYGNFPDTSRAQMPSPRRGEVNGTPHGLPRPGKTNRKHTG